MDVRVREILLPCGLIALVSDEDYLRVSKVAWCHCGGGYVHGRFKRSIGGDGRLVLLHRFIMGAPSGYVVDHIDENPLNNTRENLQITTNSRNSMRSRGRTGGVTRLHQNKGWRARLRVDGKMVSFGCYRTREAAEQAVERARKRVWEDPHINVLGTIL